MSEWLNPQENTDAPAPESREEPVTQPVPEPTADPVDVVSTEAVPPSEEASVPTPQSPVTPPAAESDNPPSPSYAGGWYRSGPMPGGSTPTPQPWNGAPQSPVPPRPPIPPQPPKKKGGNGLVIALAVIGSITALAMVVLLGLAIADTYSAVDTVPDSPSTEQSETVNDNAPTLNITDWADDDGGLSAAEIIEANNDNTVVIATYQMRSPSAQYGYVFGSEILTQVGEASGIVMSKDGYIITNWHVLFDEDSGEKYDRVDVTLHDGTVYEDAKVIGADQSTDLAVIKVEASDLSVAEFGDSSKLVMGDRVVALGNAGGLQWSASQGIISGLARDVYEDTGYSIKCLQTDAAINPGNSGGPLINNRGQVIGINSSKIAASGYEGLGFSIPINEAKDIIDDLLKYGYVRGRVQLGITGFSVNSNGYKGFVIQSINNDSVLKGTGARVGDLITAVDGEKIDGYGELRVKLAERGVGKTVTLTLLRLDNRTGHESTFTVTCTLVESRG